MKSIECTKCGSNELIDDVGLVVCAYCRMTFLPESNKINQSIATISLFDDIQNLLNRCRDEPANRKRLANLILDIDPTNLEALRYLS